MKVLDLRCANGHGFEGWFGSDDEYMDQNGRGLVECPLCADRVISRLPSAPRLNLSGAREAPPANGAARAGGPAGTPGPSAAGAPGGVAEGTPADLQAAWLHAVREMLANTEDVGTRFAEEARRIHYGEVAQRGIRGEATPAERQALHDEGIEVVSIPVPRLLGGPVQ